MKKNVYWLSAFSMTSLTVWLGFFQKRADFESFLAFYSLFFAVFLWILKAQTTVFEPFFNPKSAVEKGQGRLIQLFWLGLFLRFLLLFSEPNLSDDIWRFVWDGRLLLAGRDPFFATPSALMADPDFPQAAFADLFSKLNSKPFHSVYPPVCQAVFWAAAFFERLFGSTAAAVFSIKFFLFCCELGTGWLLFRGFKKLAAGAFLVYWLNPLAILEVVGNGHFEGAAVFFIVAGLYFLQKKEGDSRHSLENSWHETESRASVASRAIDQPRASILRPSTSYLFPFAFALAICSKLTPLLFLPFFVRKMGGLSGFLKMVAAVGAFCGLLFWPFFSLKSLENIASSLDLYFRAFEINASLYYIGRAAGFAATGWNEIGWLGPAVAAAGGAAILGLAVAVFFRKMRLADGLVWAAAFHLFFSTTVHAWYLLPMLALSVFSEKARLFPLFWTGLIALSYAHYRQGAFAENYFLIALEYAGVAAAIGVEFFLLSKRRKR